MTDDPTNYETPPLWGEEWYRLVKIILHRRRPRSKRSSVSIGPDDPRWNSDPPGPLVRNLLKRLNDPKG
jgi:hypothetical protein